MDRPFPAPHPGAGHLVVDVMRERSAFLPQVGMRRGRQVAQGVQEAGIARKGHGFGGRAHGRAHGPVHGARLCPAQVFAVLAVALIDQLAVDVLAIGLNDGRICSELSAAPLGTARIEVPSAK